MGPDERAKVSKIRDGGTRWFTTVAMLSMVNSLLEAAGVRFTFAFGLGFTQLFDALRRDPKFGTFTWIALVWSVSMIFFLLGRMAQRGRTWAWHVGLALYAVDALLFVGYGNWVGVAVHAFAGFGMVAGWRAHRALVRAAQPVPAAV